MTYEIFLSDCLDTDTGLWRLPSQSVDVLITDPPYGRDTHSKQRSGSRMPRGSPDGMQISKSRGLGFEHLGEAEMFESAKQFARIAKRWIVVFCDTWQINEWKFKLDASQIEVIRCGLWTKPNPAPQFTGDRPGTGWEGIIIAHKPGRKRWNGGGRPAIYDCPIVAPGPGRVHTTQKPLELMEAILRDFSDPGEIICDPYMGSGTTGVAALRNGRNFIGFERNPKHFENAKKRLDTVREQGTLDTVPRSEQSKEETTHERQEGQDQGKQEGEGSGGTVAGPCPAGGLREASGGSGQGRQLGLGLRD